MKIIVINSSGKIGKSLIAREVFYQNMPEDTLYAEIETQNVGTQGVDGVTCQRMKAVSILDTSSIQQLVQTDNVVVDIGASEIKTFFETIHEIDNFMDGFDLLIVPCRSGDVSIQRDTTRTTYVLAKTLGVDPKKIRIIFNEVPIGSDSKEEIMKDNEILFTEASKFCTLNPEWYIHKLQVVGKLIAAKKLSSVVLSDETDYSAKIIENKSDKELGNQYAEKLLLKKMSTKFNKQCKDLYHQIIKK